MFGVLDEYLEDALIGTENGVHHVRNVVNDRRFMSRLRERLDAIAHKAELTPMYFGPRTPIYIDAETPFDEVFRERTGVVWSDFVLSAYSDRQYREHKEFGPAERDEASGKLRTLGYGVKYSLSSVRYILERALSDSVLAGTDLQWTRPMKVRDTLHERIREGKYSNNAAVINARVLEARSVFEVGLALEIGVRPH